MNNKRKVASSNTKPAIGYQCKKGRHDLCTKRACTCNCGHVTP